MSTWESWAAAQRTAMAETNWGLFAKSHSCTLVTFNLDEVVSNGINMTDIPAGIVVDAVSLIGRCGGSAPPTGTTGASPDISSYCPNMTYCNYGSIKDGVAAVGTATVNGTPNFMAAAYTYTNSSGHTFGHAELGKGSTCSVGTLVANESPEVTLYTGQYGEVIWGPRNFSNVWSSTWWQDTGGGHYTKFGTVCGYY
jgi:hypothetical protein